MIRQSPPESEDLALQEEERFWSDFPGLGIGLIKGHEKITERAVRRVALTSRLGLIVEGA